MEVLHRKGTDPLSIEAAQKRFLGVYASEALGLWDGLLDGFSVYPADKETASWVGFWGAARYEHPELAGRNPQTGGRPGATPGEALASPELAEVLSETEAGGVTPEQIRDLIQQAEQAAAAADRAEVPLLARLRQGYRDLIEAQACEVDKRATKAEKQYAEHISRVNALLAQLSELEGGAGFVPESTYKRAVVDLMATSGNGKTTPADLGAVIIPRSELLAAEAQALRQQAAEIRGRKVRNTGRITAYSLDELLAELDKPGLIAPAAAEVRAWFTGLAGDVGRLTAQIAASNEAQRVSYLLAWRDGRIDVKASGVMAEPVTVWRTGPLSGRAFGEGPAYTT